MYGVINLDHNLTLHIIITKLQAKPINFTNNKQWREATFFSFFCHFVICIHPPLQWTIIMPGQIEVIDFHCQKLYLLAGDGKKQGFCQSS